jgi:hypothetical protein
MMQNLRRQARHLVIKNGYLLCQTISFASFAHSHFAWHLAKDKRASRSEILKEYSAH